MLNTRTVPQRAYLLIHTLRATTGGAVSGGAAASTNSRASSSSSSSSTSAIRLKLGKASVVNGTSLNRQSTAAVAAAASAKAGPLYTWEDE
jgi:hypothetical protein